MAALDKPSQIYGAGDGPDWRRRVAIAVNWLLSRPTVFSSGVIDLGDSSASGGVLDMGGA